MTAAKKLDLLSVEEYLDMERRATTKHEYVAGAVYAMAGGKNRHHQLSSRIMVMFGAALQGKPCEPYNSDTKLRIQYATHTCFYYPDVMVICDSNAPDDVYQDHPLVIVEVLSKSTRRIDEGEKKEAYLTLPSLKCYLLVEQEKPKIVVHRRTSQGFVREVYEGLESSVPLAEIEYAMPLARLYDGVEFGLEIAVTEE